MEDLLVNRVASSGLVTINLEDFFPKGEIAHFDLVDYLFMGLILKEKDFREALKNHDWTQYRDKVLLVYCSNDSIIPVWAFTSPMPMQSLHSAIHCTKLRPEGRSIRTSDASICCSCMR